MKSRRLPGFGLSMGVALTGLSLLVLIPMSTIAIKAGGAGFSGFMAAVSSPQALSALRLSFGTSIVAALLNVPFGLCVAWVLVRYDFPGRRICDAIVDVPFALPTAVAGIALTALYAKTGWLGGILARAHVDVAFTPVGIVLALMFVGLPFVVRSVQPVIEDLDLDAEEAAAALGAGRLATFRRVTLPELWPALVSGLSQAFARGVGEYGSVVFIAGNKPMKTEIAPVIIMTKLEQYDYAGAASIAITMLAASFLVLAVVGVLGSRAGRRRQDAAG